jgi:glutathione peroxidase
MSLRRTGEISVPRAFCRAGLGVVLALYAAGVAACSGASEPREARAAAPEANESSASIHGLTVKTLDGRTQSLGAYAGKVLLLVNTASECGYTPQYQGLEQLYQRYKAQGFEVLGFPSNDFGGQEPGSDAEIQAFCRSKYGVTFPMFSKSAVKGDESSPLYRLLAKKHGEPEWNFHKYLVNQEGRVIGAFPSKVEPDSPLLLAAIEEALKPK